MAVSPRTDHAATSAAQGQPPGIERSQRGSVLSYLTGLAFAIVLTLASFWAADTHLVWQPAVPVLLAALAIGQMGVHVVFFFHISTAPATPTTSWRSPSASSWSGWSYSARC
jgi:heme/copper-type cytochrome/quinol oxidase subunit 4